MLFDDACLCVQCTDDSNYCGQYRRGKRHGYGVYSFPNGDQYLGEYEEDIPQVSNWPMCQLMLGIQHSVYSVVRDSMVHILHVCSTTCRCRQSVPVMEAAAARHCQTVLDTAKCLWQSACGKSQCNGTAAAAV